MVSKLAAASLTMHAVSPSIADMKLLISATLPLQLLFIHQVHLSKVWAHKTFQLEAQNIPLWGRAGWAGSLLEEDVGCQEPSPDTTSLSVSDCPRQTPQSHQGSQWNSSWMPSQADWVKLIISSCHNESISSTQRLSISTVATHLIQLNFTRAPFYRWQPWCRLGLF